MTVKLLTRLQAMEYLSIGSTTFKKWEKQGLIKSKSASKHGVTTRKRYSVVDLDKVFK